MKKIAIGLVCGAALGALGVFGYIAYVLSGGLEPAALVDNDPGPPADLPPLSAGG